MTESIQPRVKIEATWEVEVEDHPDEQMVAVNLLSWKTGEIRQKRISYDTIARRVFQHETKTWAKYGYAKIEIVPRKAISKAEERS